MGRGNHYMRDEEGNSISTYYIPTEAIPITDEETGEVLEYESEWDDIEGNLQHIKGLTPCDEWKSREEKVIAENGVLQLVIADNEWSVAVACVPKYTDKGTIMPSYNRSAQRIMQEIHNMYRLSVRTSAWTSGQITEPTYSFY